MHASALPITGVVPTLNRESAFLRMLDDFEANDPANADAYAPARGQFASYVRALLDHERGQNLPVNWVPCTHRWLLALDGSIVGATRLRHRIDTPFLTADGGHIGYDIAPAQRGRRYGHRALQVALAEARRQDLDRVLLVAGETNLASRKIIEHRGGVLVSLGYSTYWREYVRRYWIDLASDIRDTGPQ